MCGVYSLYFLVLCWAVNVCAMEAPPRYTPKKNPLPMALAKKYTEKVYTAIEQKSVVDLQGALLEIEATDRLFEVIGNPTFFSTLHQRAKQELWKLTHAKSDKLVDSHEGTSKEPQETGKNPLLNTELLFERSKAIQPHDPQAAAVAEDLETKMFEKQIEEEEALAQAREFEAKAKRAKEVRAQLAQDYIIVGQKNPDATKESKILDIREEERAAAAAQAQRSWWATFIDWKKYYWG